MESAICVRMNARPNIQYVERREPNVGRDSNVPHNQAQFTEMRRYRQYAEGRFRVPDFQSQAAQRQMPDACAGPASFDPHDGRAICR